MTDDEEMESTWEPWETEASTYLIVKDTEGTSVRTPFSAYAGTFSEAKTTMLVHLGWLLLEHGYFPSWIKRSDG